MSLHEGICFDQHLIITVTSSSKMSAAVKAHEVLEKLDQKSFGFFHIKMIVVSKKLQLKPSSLTTIWKQQ